MPTETVLIFANPIAGRGRSLAIARRLESAMTQEGFRVDLLLDRPSQVDVSEDQLNSIAAITIGGDGTLRSVAERLLEMGKRVPALLPIPLGTANLMGRHLGIRWPWRHLESAVLATLRANKSVALDAARANGKLSLLMVGVGIDASVVHILDRMRKGPIDFTSYALPAALTLAGYSFPALSVSIDGRPVAAQIPAVAFVGNIPEYGTGFPILTRARPDDGLLDLCVMPCRNRFELAEILMHVASGDHPMREGVIYLQGKTVNITSDQSVPVQLDGDSAGHTPVKVEVLPSAVRFLIPA